MMKNVITLTSIFLSTAILIGCHVATQLPEGSASTANACNVGTVQLTTDFPTGRLGKCEKHSSNEFSVTLVPENTPINSSPWYAFKLSAEQETKVKVAIKVEGYSHRYLPKISSNRKAWKLYPFKMQQDEMVLEVNASVSPVYIAGQEIIDNQYYVDWQNKLAKLNKLAVEPFARSVQGRTMYKLESTQPNNKEWLVVLGRMHPPEITGALALFPFVETLLSDSDAAKAFRDRFNIIIVPNLNPDGVELGNWRHNTNGVDLNRDWNKFQQPEVKAVDQLLESIVEDGGKISMAVDFHSTHKDIFYTMPNDYGMEQRFLVNNWLNKLDKQYPNFSVIQKPGNNPGRGVFKQYVADKYNVHAITYEMGDNTDRGFISRLANDAALSLMETMLKNNDEKH